MLGHGSRHMVRLQLDTQTTTPLFDTEKNENFFMVALNNEDTPFAVQSNGIKGIYDYSSVPKSFISTIQMGEY